MNRIFHLPVQRNAQQARKALAQLDWPNGLAVSPDNLECHSAWLPFEPTTGTSLLDRKKRPRLSRIVLSSKLASAKNVQTGPPQHLRGKTINRDVLFAPFYQFRDPVYNENWAVVDAFEGNVACGDLKAKGRSAKARLAVLVVLALFTFFLGTAYVYLGLSTAFGLIGPLLMLTTGLSRIAVIVLLLVLFYWVFRWMNGNREALFTMLQEPIARVESGHIALPLDRLWLALLRWAGKLALVLVPVNTLALLMSASGLEIIPGMLRLLQLALALVFGILALRLGRGDWLPLGAFTRGPEDFNLPVGPAADLVKVVLDVSLLAMYGLVVGHVLDLFDFGGMLSEVVHAHLGSLAGIGVRAGALAGVILSGVDRRDRLLIAVAMSGELLVEFLMPPRMGILILFGIVAIATRTCKRSAPGSASHTPAGYWEALQSGWAYCFGALIGGLAGGIVGLALMGGGGMVLGEALGDRVIAAAALMRHQASDEP